MVRDVDAFLADAEDVIDDWESSLDAASWSADGSHEYDSDGDYYLSRPYPFVMADRWLRARAADDEVRGARPSFVVWDEAQVFIAPVDTPLPTVGDLDATWQRLRAAFQPALTQIADMQLSRFTSAVHRQGQDVDGADPDAPTDDARRPVARRHGVDAQHSPFGPQRRSRS